MPLKHANCVVRVRGTVVNLGNLFQDLGNFDFVIGVGKNLVIFESNRGIF